MYYGYIVEVQQLTKHPNADRLQILTVLGEQVIVGLDVKIGDLGIYFPAGGQLSESYCDENHLCRKNSQGFADTGYLDGDKRNIKAIRLRGARSEGLFAPLSSLEFTGVDVSKFQRGHRIDVVNGVDICKKYIPKVNYRSHGPGRQSNKIGPSAKDLAPFFKEHKDTEQLAYNLDGFKLGDQIEITLKMHGTSQRTGYLPVLQGYRANSLLIRYVLGKYHSSQGKCAKWIQKLAQGAIQSGVAEPVYEYDYINGTRRTVKSTWGEGFYGSDEFRSKASDFFIGKLWKGETVYYEVVGYTTNGTPIMPSASNKGLDEEFISRYGETTDFSYGCNVGECDFYVYRMTMTNQDGGVIEYTPDFMRIRCEQMGAKTVPVLWKGYIDTLPLLFAAADSYVNKAIVEEIQKYVPNFDLNDIAKETDLGKLILRLAEVYYDGPDPIGKTHVREGVVVRVVNAPSFRAYKHKNFSFKVLSGIAIDKISEDQNLDVSEDILSEM